jgi:hypothetical protein
MICAKCNTENSFTQDFVLRIDEDYRHVLYVDFHRSPAQSCLEPLRVWIALALGVKASSLR